jgi:hypothetical protein
MNQDKPIYCIKSRNGRIEKEGDFAEIVSWLRENRINSDDDLRRLGFAVFEKDELWARVKDFPEFNLTDREGRQKLVKATKKAKVAWAFAAVVFAVGFGLIAWNQLWPRYVESVKVAESQKMAEDAKADAAAKVKKGQEDADASIKKAFAEADASKQEAASELKSAAAIKAAADKLDADARAAVADYKTQLARALLERNAAIKAKDAAELSRDQALASVQRQIESKTAALQQELNRVTGQYTQVSQQLLDLKQTMPLQRRFTQRIGLLGGSWYDFEYLNTSQQPLSLRFKITRADGSVLEKTYKAKQGDWTKLQIENYEFHQDDTVIITAVDDDLGRFKSVLERCPPDKVK